MDMNKAKTGFHISAIKNKEKLFGWNKKGDLLDSLLASAFNGRSIFLQGERRSGKTSLLKCLESELRNNCDYILPVYIDCQKFAIFDESPYNHILYLMVESILKNISNGSILSKNDICILGNYTLDDIIEKDQEFTTRQCIIAYDNITDFLKKHHSNMLLLFDEYEYFAQCNVRNEDRNNSFNPFRSQIDKFTRDEGGIFCFISGAEDLSHFQARTGSPQFNLFTKTEQVPPLNFDDFSEMWNDCLLGCNSIAIQNLKKCSPSLEELYNMCGGRPAFAKVLGEHWSLDGTDDKDMLYQWFEDIFNRQTETAKTMLLDISVNKSVKENESTKYLLKMFLIQKNPDREIGGYCIHGDLLKIFLQNKHNTLYEPKLEHAGDLARLIISSKLLPNLLKIRYQKGEFSDWLEFKATLIPDKKQKESDETQKGISFSNDDYIWHVVKAIIAMRNTRGGLILIGVDDKGDIIGINTNNQNDGDFLRKYLFNRISKCNYNLNKSKSKIDLSKSSWNKSDILNFLSYGIEDIDNKKIIYLCINPVQPRNISQYYIKDSDMEGKRSKKYILIRSKLQENEELIFDEDDDLKKIEEHFHQMRHIDVTDLHKFLLTLRP